jgi:hypothetical protein
VTGFSGSDRDGVCMDIETEVEFNSRDGVAASSYSQGEAERLPRPLRGRACGSACLGNLRSK